MFIKYFPVALFLMATEGSATEKEDDSPNLHRQLQQAEQELEKLRLESNEICKEYSEQICTMTPDGLQIAKELPSDHPFPKNYDLIASKFQEVEKLRKLINEDNKEVKSNLGS